MKSPLIILLFSLASVLYACAEEQPSSGANSKPSDTAYVKPFSFVLYLTDASPGVIRLAKQVSSTYGLLEPQAVSGNPACCFWLEVTPSHSKLGVPYYSVTVLKQGETMIYASSEDLLEKAVNRLKDSAHSQSGNLFVPVGSFSYYAQ